MAAALAGGLAGLTEQLDPPAPFDGNAWGLPPEDGLALPKSIRTASSALRGDDRLRQWLGDDFVEFWAGSQDWEWFAFHTTGGDPDVALSDWELRRYFERV